MTERTQVHSPDESVPLVAAVVLLALGAVIGGIVGAGAAILGIALAHRWGPRVPAAAAIATLALAAVLSVVESPATGRGPDYLFDFALDRPVASDFGLAAGVLVLVSVVLSAWSERAPRGQVDGAPGVRDDGSEPTTDDG